MMRNMDDPTLEVVLVVKDVLRRQGWKDGAEVRKLEHRCQLAEEAARDANKALMEVRLIVDDALVEPNNAEDKG